MITLDFYSSARCNKVHEHIDARRFVEVTQSARVAELINRFRNGDEAAKKQLPAVTFMGHSTTGRRRTDDTLPTGLVMLDIDHANEHLDELVALTTGDAFVSAVHPVLVHITPSGMGLRIVFPMPSGCSTVIQAQERVVTSFGLAAYGDFDRACKDLTRLSFLPQHSDIKLLDLDALFSPEPEPAAAAAPAPGEGKGERVTTELSRTGQAAGPAPAPADAPAPANEAETTHYCGHPISKILAKYWELYYDGHEPESGAREAKTFEIAALLAPVCNYDARALEQVVPVYNGLPLDEWRHALASGAERSRGGIPYKLNRIVKELNRQGMMRSIGGSDCAPPEMPRRLPPVLAHLTKNAPTLYRAAMCEGVWPALGAHLHGVQVRYIDGRVIEPAFMNLLIAPQSAGKSSIKTPIDYIMAPIVERDEVNRLRENEWKLENPTTSAKRERRPSDICIQYLGNDLTNAVFSMRVCDADRNGGRVLYSIFDEVECMKSVTSKGGIDEVTKIIRTAFDHSLHGQERATSEGYTGMAPLRWNFNVSTTPSNGRQFFNRGAIDGTLSRLNVSTILTGGKAYDTEIPVFGRYTDDYATELQPFLQKLEMMSGVIECPEAERLARNIIKEINDSARDFESESYALLGRRACVMGYFKAVVLYALSDYTWSRDIANYVRWSVKMDLWCKMLYFGERVEDECKKQSVCTVRNPRRLLEQLPEEFSEQDYADVLKLNGLSSSKKSTIRSWMSRGKVEKDSITGRYRKITVAVA